MSRTARPVNPHFKASLALAEKAVQGGRQVLLTLPPAHPKQYELITIMDRDPNVRFVVGACGTKPSPPSPCV